MSRYRRAHIEGGTFFFTVTLADRASDLLVKHIDELRRIYVSVGERYPFQTIAICVLPDHLHAIWRLPEQDADFPLRWNLIKSAFSRKLPITYPRSASKIAKREKGIWARRYWEHIIRNSNDMNRHIDYIHYNPVKHRLVSRAADWPYSSFHRYVARGDLPNDWGGRDGEISGTFGEWSRGQRRVPRLCPPYGCYDHSVHLPILIGPPRLLTA